MDTTETLDNQIFNIIEEIQDIIDNIQGQLDVDYLCEKVQQPCRDWKSFKDMKGKKASNNH